MRTQTLRFYWKQVFACSFMFSTILWVFCDFLPYFTRQKTPAKQIFRKIGYDLPCRRSFRVAATAKDLIRDLWSTQILRSPLVVFACLSRQVRQMTWQGSCAQGCPSRRKCRALFSFYMRFDPARIIVTVLGAKISMVSWLFEWTRRIIVAWQFWHCTLISLSLFLKPETNCPQLAQNHEYACQSSFANRWYSPYFRHGRNKG